MRAVLSLRRVMYATYFLTGSRFAEILPLRVCDYTRREPWAALTIPASKVGRHTGRRMRHAPVFPALQAWLDWWLSEEYAILFGRPPQPNDLLFPTFSVRRRNKGEARCSHNEIYKQWSRNDLPAAGLRHRRLHDARRTYVSVLRSSGVPDKAVRAVTHGSTGDRILDAYTSWDWAELCRELGRVDWPLPTPPSTATAAVFYERERTETPDEAEDYYRRIGRPRRTRTQPVPICAADRDSPENKPELDLTR